MHCLWSSRTELITTSYWSQEHQGNDPNTQLVPSGAAGTGWSKPEEPQQQPQPQPQPEVRQSALTAGSNWASSQRSASSGWVPPAREGPFAAGSAAPRGSFPVDRHLNPEEYPSLAATGKEKPEKKKKQYEQQARDRHQVGVAANECLQDLGITTWACQQQGGSSHVHSLHFSASQRAAAALKTVSPVSSRDLRSAPANGRGQR